MLGISKTKNETARNETPERFTTPAADVFENDQEILLLADLPGVAQNGTEITLENDRLTLKASAAARKYRREFVVPPSIDAEKVSASMKAGVLTLHLPKRPAYKPRQIEVRSS
jgi:HSP20 family molecular chaperone IbpA